MSKNTCRTIGRTKSLRTLNDGMALHENHRTRLEYGSEKLLSPLRNMLAVDFIRYNRQQARRSAEVGDERGRCDWPSSLLLSVFVVVVNEWKVVVEES